MTGATTSSSPPAATKSPPLWNRPAPSSAAGRLGGGKTNSAVLRPQVPRFPDEPPVRWAERDFPPDSPLRRGLFGARTAYSTGSGTVAEYVAKAGLKVWACAIVPDHVHMVVARHRLSFEQIVIQLKGAATPV